MNELKGIRCLILLKIYPILIPYYHLTIIPEALLYSNIFQNRWNNIPLVNLLKVYSPYIYLENKIEKNALPLSN